MIMATYTPGALLKHFMTFITCTQSKPEITKLMRFNSRNTFQCWHLTARACREGLDHSSAAAVKAGCTVLLQLSPKAAVQPQPQIISHCS